MTGTLSLNGTWSLSHTDDFPQFLTGDALPGRHAFAAEVPAPIHKVLMNAGVLDDPNVGMNSLRARWVEEMYWSYRRTFATPEGIGVGTASWLVFVRLEMNAVVYLNGVEVGRHANAHRPARFDVTNHLRPAGKENQVIVLIEAGLFDCADKPGEEYRASPQAKLTKIHWQRRGQWQRGWDWQQRLLNVGILGDVRLEWSDTPFLGGMTAFAVLDAKMRRAIFHVFLDVLNGSQTDQTSKVSISIGRAELGIVGEKAFPPGESRHHFMAELRKPNLWWPIGHGEQHLYEVKAWFAGQAASSGLSRRIGVRKVEVDQSPHPVEGKHFILKINDRPIFCKGGNWVPADMLYSMVTPERYRELVDLALGANFNLLRIWGGGVFADRALLDYCDEKGVLVWHDLLFACSKYPGDHPEFAAEVRREVRWAMREMAHHPSLVVWCGNNEIEEGDWHWGYDDAYRTHPHYALFHHDLPQIAAQEDPSKFYWISSPYSPDYKSPRDPTVGDQHPWKVSLQVPGGADWWEYRTFVDRFPNEGGVLGASSPATLRQFLPENERYLLSPSWEHHDNPFAINDTQPGRLGHAYQTVQLWTGRNPLEMDWEQYAFVSALLQAEGITEYITNYRRRMFSSAAAIFWMYNDSWPVTHGWTIVDYYRRKKLAYHPVRRAFTPVTVVMAETRTEEPQIATLFGINDSPHDWTGYWSANRLTLPGPYIVKAPKRNRITLPANSVVELSNWGLMSEAHMANVGWFGALHDEAGNLIAQHRAFFRRFGDLELERNPDIEMSVDKGVLTFQSNTFCWGVCLDIDGELPLADNCFDLLPGVPYTLPWDSAVLGEPRIVRLGNRDAV